METVTLTYPLLIIVAGILLGWMFSLPLFQSRLNAVRMGWLLALFPATAFSLLVALWTGHPEGKALTFNMSWIPSLGIHFSVYLDGLSLLFALLVTGIGTLVTVYAGYYFGEDTTAWRFKTYLLLFMTAMLGLVMAGDLITLFLFWEGTSISSFLLIAYKYKDETARAGALKSLLITGGGGIALLAGFVFIMVTAGGSDFQTVLASGDLLKASPLYPVFFTLIALGAFTKSAQVPAHIWLPNAMTAPTPASAFLHSATMVKAGVYLLARLNPALGNTELWFWTLSLVGLTTMLVGAYLGFKQNDLKPLLAYSTISQLGVLVALIGQDTEIAFKALVIGIFAHALYKSALFMLAGIVDHETGTRDLRVLGGLRAKMPVTFGLVLIAGLSMAGFPPLFGFLAKETLLATVTHPDLPALVNTLFPLVAVLAGALILAQAFLLIWETFVKKSAGKPLNAHDPAWGMWLAPAIPAVLSLAIGLLPEPAFLANFLADAAKAAYGDKVKVSLALWTGINVPLLLSLVAIALGTTVFALRQRVRPLMSSLAPGFTANALFDGAVVMLDGLAKTATRLQRGRLRFYLVVMLVSLGGLVVGFGGLTGLVWNEVSLNLGDLQGLRLFSLAMVVSAALASVVIWRDLHAVIALGISGLGVAVWMALAPSPDVALVQVVVDILATIVLILSLEIIPRKLREKAQEFTYRQSQRGLLRDALVAVIAGAIVTALTWTALNTLPRTSVVSPFYAENAKPLTGAKDIVGAIVVDFRGLDTMVEIMVFSLAGLGILTLLHYVERKAGYQTGDIPKPSSEPDTPLGIHGLPTSSLLHTLAYVMLPLAFLLSITHMIYGHDQPGDGFTAGVIISLAIAEWYMLFGYGETRKKLRWLRPRRLIANGLGLALLNALAGMAFGAGFFAPVNYGKMLALPLPPGFSLSNSFLFEVAICLAVTGAATLILDNLGHPREGEPNRPAMTTDVPLFAEEVEV